MSNLEDPLEAYDGLSIFRRTFSSLPPNPPPPYRSDDDLLSATHNFLISLPVQNPEKLIEQAKVILNCSSELVRNPEKLLEQGKNILDSSSEHSRKLESLIEPVKDNLGTISELPKTKMKNDVALDDREEVVSKNGVRSPRKQRPGLGRKRARFSLLPDSTQPVPNLEPTLDIDKLKDPEEFFLAFERLQNAKKEIAKQTGHASLDSDQYVTSMAPRPHRPGIPGRSRTAKYVHLYPTSSSQEILQGDILSPSSHSTQKEGAYIEQKEVENTDFQPMEPSEVVSQETVLAGSITKAENGINKLLEDLLSRDYEELDGDGALTLLQEQLHMKPLDIQQLELPQFQEIQKIDFNASASFLSKPGNVLSDIQNLLQVPRGKTPKQKAEISTPHLGSPSPPKNPWASLSLLRKRILQSTPLNDPFSVDDIGQSPARNSSPSNGSNRSSNPFDMEKNSNSCCKLKSLMIEDDGWVGGVNSLKSSIGDLIKSGNDNITDLAPSGNVGPRESCNGLEDKDVGMHNELVNENLPGPDTDRDFQVNGPSGITSTVEDVQQKGVASAQPDRNMDELPAEILNDVRNQCDQSCPAMFEEHALDGYSKIHGSDTEKTPVTGSEEQNEEIQVPSVTSMSEQSKGKVHSGKGQKNKEIPMNEQSKANSLSGKQQKNKQKSMNEQSKAKTRVGKGRKKKDISKRQSLAAHGTSWETGVRRSTRIRSQPLKYWKGERFLYGRIHGSLPSVIGIKKYGSPGANDRKPTIKVESYVSDEYKNLVELAALH